MTKEKKNMMVLHMMAGWLVDNGSTRIHSGTQSACHLLPHGRKNQSSLTGILRTMFLAVMMVVGVGGVKADDFSGTYYIKSNENATFYLCTSTVFYDGNHYANSGDMPYLTTATTATIGTMDDAVWRIIKAESGDFYYVVHAIDGKYLTLNDDPTNNGDKSRLRVHLQYLKDGVNSLFVIKKNSTWYNISPKSDSGRSLNPAGDNYDSRAGTNGKTQNIAGAGSSLNVGGLIGLWGNGDVRSKWQFETVTGKPNCEAPTFENNGTVSISCSTTGAAIYYTTDGSIPTTGSSLYSSTPITVTESIDYIWARATTQSSDPYYWSTMSVYEIPQCEKPTITNINGTIEIVCATIGAEIHYTKDGSTPTSSSTLYNESFTAGENPVIRAIAFKTGYHSSEVASYEPPKTVHNSGEIDKMYGSYILASDFTLSSSIGTESTPFTGTIDGKLRVLSGFSQALVAYANGATIKNVILDNVTISGGTNAGAIANEATGDSRIYNCGVLATDSEVETDKDGYTEITSCSSTISGSGYVGGIVGLLDGSSRVINCFSYANITGGNLVGGIVGKNNVATTSTNLQTMVMNCMFYGDITDGSSKAPIYNGEIITNRSDASGVSNFNYFWAEASYVQGQHIDVYNCALSAETRFLQRFEFFRHLLNSNRALAAWWATGDADNKDMMAKWVLEPSQIGTSIPYPILKAPYDSENQIIKYPSVVNIDAANAEAFSINAETAKTQYNQGRKFSTTFTIKIQNAQSGAPTGADIITTPVTPNITDKDPKHFNFNYHKVQLPYYNDVGTLNYTGNKVVTGWKIVSISDGTHSYSTSSSDASASVSEGDITLTTPYNFADRKCTDKDKFSVGGRVFSQGAYFDVPEGVTSITIEPYWGKCVYVSDEYSDVVYDQDMTAATSVTIVGGGKRYADNKITIDGSEQTVYTSMSAAVTGLNPSGTVYDNAIVLVGNVHSLSLSNSANNKPFTIMSVDLDKDNEPDYSYILRFNGRVRVHPVRVDFLNVIGLGMAQKSNEGKGTYNFGIMQPYGWFEVTNTGLFRVTQLEYDRVGRVNSPMILHGGVIEQWVTIGETESGATEANAVSYYHVGSNVWFKEFHIGAHQDKNRLSNKDDFYSPHPPISVTGGDFNEFYLTGLYNTPNNNYDDNAECYINGGHFGKVAGTGYQGLGASDGNSKGDIIWQIDNADIDEFYAGGINAAHKAEGNIYTVISNSRVDQFCGGPKFGDMNSDKKVVTNADNCTFRTFFGAGYGGNSYNRRYPVNKDKVINIDWDGWVSSEYKKEYNSANSGVETRIDYQFIPQSDNTQNVARLFVDHVSFSLATTHDVTSKLTGCTITKSSLGRLNLSYGLGNFYGGGSLGKVTGPVKSTLTNCTIEGNVFGAGYSATLPTVAVMNNSFQTEPRYDENLGAYLEAVLPTTESYSWEHAETVNSTATAINTGTHKLFTTVDLDKSNLGSVEGNVTLTLTTSGENGKTKIGTDGDTTTGHVYGGGDESSVIGSANTVTVTLKGNAEVLGNVFGGGNNGAVSGSTTVNIEE